MYLSFLTTTAYLLCALFLFILYRAFGKKKLQLLWQIARNKVNTEIKLQSEIKKAEEKGQKPFTIPGTKTTIYAKTFFAAVLKHRNIKMQQVEEENTLQLRRKSRKLKKATKAS